MVPARRENTFVFTEVKVGILAFYVVWNSVNNNQLIHSSIATVYSFKWEKLSVPCFAGRIPENPKMAHVGDEAADRTEKKKEKKRQRWKAKDNLTTPSNNDTQQSSFRDRTSSAAAKRSNSYHLYLPKVVG